MNAGSRPRLRLHGYPVSNYFNIAHAALLEKRATFDIVIVRASQDHEFLKVSPMGKIPFLETADGWIAETVAILEYLEETVDGPALYPPDPFLRARARQIINIVQMYVEAPARSLFPGVFSGSTNSDAAVSATRHMLDRASLALGLLVQPRPFLLGPAISYADLFAFYCLDIADRVSRFVYSRSIVEEIGALSEWSSAMADRASSRTVFANFYPAFAAYLDGHAAPYDYHRDTDVFVPPATVREIHV